MAASPEPPESDVDWVEREALFGWLDEIDDFLVRLAREQRIRFGLGDRLRVSTLLHRLAVRGELVHEPSRLAGWLAPPFCRSGAEQAFFRDRFLAWAAARRAGQSLPGYQSTVHGAPPDSGDVVAGVPRVWHRPALLILAGLVLAAATAYFLFSHWPLQPDYNPSGGRLERPQAEVKAEPRFGFYIPSFMPPLVPLILFWLWYGRRRRADMELYRRFAPENVPTKRVFVAAAERILFRPGPIRRHLTALRRHIAVPSQTLDL